MFNKNKAQKMLSIILVMAILFSMAPAPAVLAQGQDGLKSDAINLATSVYNLVTNVSTIFDGQQTLSGATISGTVYYSTTPLANIQVDLKTSSFALVASTTSAANGAYSFSGVAAGSYFLWVYGPNSQYTGAFGQSIYINSSNLFLMDLYLPKVISLTSPPHQSTPNAISPTFCWQGLPEASNYEFQLNKTSDWTLIDFVHNIKSNCFTTSKVLQRGVQYTWQVGANDQFNHYIGTTTAQFSFTVQKPIVVLVHGWNGMGAPPPFCSNQQVDPDSYFEQVDENLQAAGFYVGYAYLQSSACYTPSLTANVPNLMSAIDAAKAANPGQSKVILIAHSMGGLVSRAYIEGSNYRNDVSALFTFGSPHNGTPDDLLAFLLNGVTLGKACSSYQPAVCDFSVLGMRLFNQTHHVRNEVVYHAIAGNAPLLSRNAKGIATGALIPGNDDGIVPTDSARAATLGTFDRWTTDEVHHPVFGSRAYFIRDGGLSTSYSQCIKKVLIDGASNCGSIGVSSAAVIAPAMLAQHTPIEYGTLLTGQSDSGDISLEGGPTLFAAQWQDGTMSLTLTDPNGHTINPAYAASHPSAVTYTADATGGTYYFPNAISGNWQMTLQAVNVPVDGTMFSTFAAFDSNVAITGNLDQEWYTPGNTATITATLDGSPSTATVTASILRPDNATDIVALSSMGNGQYQAGYVVPNIPGYAEVRLVATGTTASNLPYERGTSLAFQIAPNTLSLNNSYSDTPSLYPNTSLFESLDVTIGVQATTAGKAGLSTDLVDGNGNFVAHGVSVQDVNSGVNLITVKFSGADIFASQQSGPYTLTNIILSDESSSSLVVQEATDAYITAAYLYTDFADTIPPFVVSITRADPNPTSASTVDFMVTFSKSVTGINSSIPFNDFFVVTPGITGAVITNVSGSDATYTVTVSTGSGNGTIRLNVADDDSIVDDLNNPLGGTGSGNGDFNLGEEYSIVKSAPTPGIPSLVSPANGILTTTLQPVLDWKDSVPAAHHYQVQIATNNTFTSLVFNEVNILTSTFTPASELLPGKLYYWRVKAFNILGASSNWSAVRNFKTPLAQPNLVSPVNASSLLTDRPDLDWDNVDGATSYILQISPSSSFGTLLVNISVNDSEYSLPKDLPQKKLLYWRIRAKTSVVAGPWSEKWTFTTGNPASTPVLVAPANNALVKDYTPLLDWKNSTLPVGTTFKQYDLQVDDNSDFSSPEVNISTSNGVLIESSYTPLSDLAFNTKYYWRVRSVNLVSGVEHFSGWSKVWTFRAVMLAPTLQSPTNGDPVGSLKPTLTWTAVTGATKYAIQITTSPSFGTPLLSTTSPVATFTPGANLPKNKTLYWRVRALGPNGPSDWSTPFSFHTPQ